MKMSILKLSDLRDLCKDPKTIEKVRSFLEENTAMDIIGEGHGGSIRAAIKANNPEALKMLLQYHREHRMDIYEPGTEEYSRALAEFKKVFDEILAEYYDVIKGVYLFSNEVKQVLEEGHYLTDEGNEQDSVLESDIDDPESPLDSELDSVHLESTLASSHDKPTGETHHLTEAY